ncbi:MAG: hypothetical protein N4A33_07720 [Bacteriovoracaceae bacterium]|jgi:hypothetical protein|nr:hypothetical protein [Bacteriovoracaceae bacterium]
MKNYILLLSITLLFLTLNLQAQSTKSIIEDNILKIYDGDNLISKIELNQMTPIHFTVDKDMKKGFIVNKKNQMFSIDLKTKELKNLDADVPFRITHSTSFEAGVFLLGDESGNVHRVELVENQKKVLSEVIDQRLNIQKPNPKFYYNVVVQSKQQLPVSSLKLLEGGMLVVEQEKDLISKIGFKYSNSLPGDNVIVEKTIGFNAEIKTAKPDAIITASSPGFGEKAKELHFTKPQTIEAKSKRTIIYNFIDNRENILYDFIDDNVSVANNKIISSNKLQNVTQILDLEMLAKTGDIQKSMGFIKGYYDYVEQSDLGLILGSRDRSELAVIDIKEGKVLGTTYQGNIAAIESVEGAALIIDDNGSVNLLTRSTDELDNVVLTQSDAKWARNTDLKRVGQNISLITKSGQRVSFKIPKKCTSLFKLKI